MDSPDASPDPAAASSAPPPAPVSHLVTLARFESGVNCVRFSPDGLSLVACGDAGAVIVWSVPMDKRGNGNGRHFWPQVECEKDLQVKVLRSQAEDIFDVAWAPDSKRFIVGSLDHKVGVFEDQSIPDSPPDAAAPQWGGVGSWKQISVLADHRHYVQGVSFDPLECYVATQGSDRQVLVFQRKERREARKKKEGGALKENPNVANEAPAAASASGEAAAAPAGDENADVPPPSAAALPTPSLPPSSAAPAPAAPAPAAAAKFELGRPKSLKWRVIRDEGAAACEKSGSDVLEEGGAKARVERHNLYVDETMQSFFRRLAWTPDGAFLVTPAGLYQEEEAAKPQFATYVFARHAFDKPVAFLADAELPSVAVRACPVQFKLPAGEPTGIAGAIAPESRPKERSVFAVLTKDSVYVYDTHHKRPLVVCKGLHYATLTDAAWTPDGRKLIVTSSDGYLSLLTFEDGELGELCDADKEKVAAGGNRKISFAAAASAPAPPAAAAAAAPSAGPASLEAPASKKRRTIVPTPVAAAAPADQSKGTKRRIAPEAVPAAGAAPQQRISPTTVETALGKVHLDQAGADENAPAAGGSNAMAAPVTVLEPKKKKRVSPELVQPLN
ncbi:hypothetical protein TeGR_g11435 [Tetraparma gracilis]|uniref:CAF1B/HIR1 beta-propeller domain-containing protein n=1 Tax=Tetraparma gracilis TaxID=2962635 RepID=A0ABQ6NC93_9STRA|nr:hypothetical protein TeGR_g11435 [Tetraparma gracilis]